MKRRLTTFDDMRRSMRSAPELKEQLDEALELLKDEQARQELKSACVEALSTLALACEALEYDSIEHIIRDLLDKPVDIPDD